MTTAIAEFTTEELELEAVELLPARETLCSWQSHPSGVRQSQGNLQFGLVNLNNTLNNNQINVLAFGNSNYGNSGNSNG